MYWGPCILVEFFALKYIYTYIRSIKFISKWREDQGAGQLEGEGEGELQLDY